MPHDYKNTIGLDLQSGSLAVRLVGPCQPNRNSEGNKERVISACHGLKTPCGFHAVHHAGSLEWHRTRAPKHVRNPRRQSGTTLANRSVAEAQDVCTFINTPDLHTTQRTKVICTVLPEHNVSCLNACVLPEHNVSCLHKMYTRAYS